MNLFSFFFLFLTRYSFVDLGLWVIVFMIGTCCIDLTVCCNARISQDVAFTGTWFAANDGFSKCLWALLDFKGRAHSIRIGGKVKVAFVSVFVFLSVWVLFEAPADCSTGSVTWVALTAANDNKVVVVVVRTATTLTIQWLNLKYDQIKLLFYIYWCH